MTVDLSAITSDLHNPSIPESLGTTTNLKSRPKGPGNETVAALLYFFGNKSNFCLFCETFEF